MFCAAGSRPGRRRAGVVARNASEAGRFFFVCRTGIVEAVTGVAGAAWPKPKIFFSTGPLRSKRVVRFTPKSLYTE